MDLSSNVNNGPSHTGFLDNPIFQAGIAFVIAAVLAYVGYWLGLRAYSKQKESEYLRTRYLDQGFDLACTQIEYALSVFRSDWALFLKFVKQCRDIPAEVDMDEFFREFRDMDQSNFQTTAMYRICSLFNARQMWNIYQAVFSKIGTGVDSIKSDYAIGLRLISDNPAHPKKDEIISGCVVFAENFDRDVSDLYFFLSCLNELAELFEAQDHTRKNFGSFKEKMEVKKVLNRIRETFPDVWEFQLDPELS